MKRIKKENNMASKNNSQFSILNSQLNRLFLLAFILFSSCISKSPEIILLTTQGNEQNAEILALRELLIGDKYSVKILSLDQFEKSSSDFDLVWYHRSDTSTISSEEIGLGNKIKEYVRKGGKLMLTLEAVRLLNEWGIEQTPIELRYRDAVDSGFGRKLGFHGFRSHPVFTEMHGGAYIWHAKQDHKVRTWGFFENNLPKAEDSKIIGIDWAYITYDEKNKLLWETPLGKGKILAVGAYTYYAPENFNRKALEKFTSNCLEYLNGNDLGTPKYFWTYEQCTVEESKHKLTKIEIPCPVKWDLTASDLGLKRKATANYYDLAGKRSLTQGKEKGGIDEIWTHPVMAARDFFIGVKLKNEDTISWLQNSTPDFEARPEAIVRTYHLSGKVEIQEIIVVDPNKPLTIAHYQWDTENIEKLVYTVKSNLRYMWPYSEEALGSLFYLWNPDSKAILVHNKSEEFASIIGTNANSKLLLNGQFDGFDYKENKWEGVTTEKLQTTFLVEVDPENDKALDICFTAGSEGIAEAENYYSEAISNPRIVFNEASAYYSNLLENTVSINTPDPVFNQGYKWALVGTSKFETETPGIGHSLMAGYSTTARGWGGAQKVSGRPGYAWYFGRDAQWASFAADNYGNFELVKNVLETFVKFQNVDGKIYHELTTSGSVHYDASDATPLFVNLFAHYLRYSGDIDFVRANWTAIEKAMDFCYSTDTDKDGLIEISNVGHGWLEGGKLYGAHTEFYLVGIWAATLKNAAYLAEMIGLTDLAKEYSEDGNKVSQAIESFWNPNNYYNYGKYKDGSYTDEFIILTSVPVYFDVLNKERAKIMTEAYAANSFSSDWGTRMISEASTLYNPRSYHFGSVWPLFSGWTSLAEYQSGRYNQGFTRIMNNLLNYNDFALGYATEVLNGENYRQAGVTSHQCWSETMVLQPLFEGMLGYKPDALQSSTELKPRIPFNWDWMEVKGLKFGNNTFDFNYKRESASEILYTFRSNTKFSLVFIPSLPLATKVKDVKVNGQSVDFSMLSNNEYADLSITHPIAVDSKTEIRVSFEGGISTLATFLKPELMSESKGFRVLKQSLKDKTFFVELEGKSGQNYVLDVYTLNKIVSCKGGKIVTGNNEKNIIPIQVQFQKSKEKYQKQTLELNIE